jgi:hypothetical protein
MIEVISAFGVRDTRDELGLGSVRDALANLFFPGTSTLQTRARYFLFVPWLYLYFEERQVPSNRIDDRLKRDEIRLIEALKTAGEDGVIGEVAGASLQRFPSSIYWNGLAEWGIRRFLGSQNQYHRWLDHFYVRQKSWLPPEDGESIGTGSGANWDPDLPDRPSPFPQEADLDLTQKEAEYLREQLLLSCPNSLLATIVDRCRPAGDVDFVWQHPQLALFPEKQQAWISHARNFSEAMYGAVLLYNLMLAEISGSEALVAAYQEVLAAWWEELPARTGGLRQWDRAAFWKLVRSEKEIPFLTKQFAERWLDLVLSADDLAQSQEARRLVRKREVWLKRGRSRFESRRHLEMWSGHAGLAQLDYRWFIARRITDDILRGLGRS